MSTILFISINAQEYALDTKKSNLKWKGYGEIGGFTQEGEISALDGSLMMKSGELVSTEIIIDMTTIENSDQNLASHLKNKDFFYVKKYPTASLRLKEFENGVLTADLTIRGITKTISFEPNIIQDGNSVMAQGEIKIDRTLYDIKYNSSSYFQDLGNYAIKNEFDLRFDLYFNIANK